MAEDLELGRGQADPPRAALDTPPLEVDDEVAMAEDATAGGVGEVAVRAAKQRLDPAEQLAQAVRLGQVVVGAELEADDLVDLVVARRQDEDRHLGAGRADAPEDLEAVDAGQAHVEDDEVGRLARRDLEPLLAGPGDADVVALLLEGVLDAARDGVLVFDDQDRGCHARGCYTAARERARPRDPGRRSRRGILRSRSGRLATPAPPASRSPTQPTNHHPRSHPWQPPARRWPPSTREITGKAVKHLRKAGRLPAVVYGHGVESTNVTVSAHDFDLLRKQVGPNALVDLSVDGKKADPVLIYDVQIHPVNRRPLHADLFLVRMTEELTVDVPLVATGDVARRRAAQRDAPPPDRDRQGQGAAGSPAAVDRVLGRVAVDFDASIYVRDLTIPDDVTLLTDPDEIIAKVQAPRIEVEEEPVVAEGEELEGEEGEGAEGAAEGEGTSGEWRGAEAPAAPGPTTASDARNVARTDRSGSFSFASPRQMQIPGTAAPVGPDHGTRCKRSTRSRPRRRLLAFDATRLGECGIRRSATDRPRSHARLRAPREHAQLPGGIAIASS